MGLSRVVWTIVAPLCILLAVIAVSTMVRETAEAPAAAAQGDTVTMEDLTFSPGEITVARGTRLLFDNKDVAPHTVTADDGSSDSGILDPGQTFALEVADGFSYHCEIHPAMKAEVQVEC